MNHLAIAVDQQLAARAGICADALTQFVRRHQKSYGRGLVEIETEDHRSCLFFARLFDRNRAMRRLFHALTWGPIRRMTSG